MERVANRLWPFFLFGKVEFTKLASRDTWQYFGNGM